MNYLIMDAYQFNAMLIVYNVYLKILAYNAEFRHFYIMELAIIVHQIVSIVHLWIIAHHVLVNINRML